MDNGDGGDSFGDPSGQEGGAVPPPPPTAPPPPLPTWSPPPAGAAHPPVEPAGPVPITPAGAGDPSVWSPPGQPPVAPLPFGPSSAPPPPPAGWEAAASGSAPPPPPAGWANGGAGAGGWPGALPVYATDAPPPPPGANAVKGRSRVALAVLSVTAVLAASTFAFVALTRPDGAGSPEAAVEDLFAALEAEDAIGVMEALPPGEREVLIEPMVATVGELQRVGVLDQFALEDVPGADIEVDGLTLQSTNLGDGISKVRVTGGSITGTIIPDQVPIGPRTRDIAERANGGDPLEIEGGSETESLADADLELVTIEEDGGWHVSLFYTLAEAARGDDTPLPAFGHGLSPVGGDTPEDAVRGLVQAGVDLDLGRAIGYLPPDEMRVLYDYGPLFVDEADEGADQARADGYQATINRLDLHSEGDGDVRRVVLDGVDVSGGTADDDTMRYTFDGNCSTIESTFRSSYFESVGSAIDEEGNLTPYPSTGSSGTVGGGSGGGSSRSETRTSEFQVCRDGSTKTIIDGEESQQDEDGYVGMRPLLFGAPEASLVQGVTVVEHEGRWYVSPVRSMFDSMLSSLRGFDGTEIDAYFESMDSLLGTSSTSRFEDVGPAITTPGGTYPSGTVPALDDAYTICSQVFEKEPGPNATADDYQALEDEYERCLLDHGETPYVEPATLGEPRFAGGHILVPANDTIEGYTLDGTPMWSGPSCSFGTWAAVIPPSVDVDVEVAECDGDLVGVAGADGAELWRIPDDERSVERTRIGPRALVRSTQDEVIVNDVRTGAELWRQPNLSTAPMVVTDAQSVYIGDDLNLTAYDVQTGVASWSTPGGVTGLGVDEGIVVTRDSTRVVRRIDPATGQVLWASEPDNEHLKSADVVAFTTETVILQSTVEPLSIVAYDLTTGAQLWVRPKPSSGGTVRADGTTVVVLDTGSGSLTRYDPRTGEAQAAIDGALPDIIELAVHGGVVASVSYPYDDDEDDMVLTVVPAP